METVKDRIKEDTSCTCKKRTPLLRVALFCILFCFLFIWFTYLMRPPDEINRKYIIGYYNEPENTIDVLWIGGSSTYGYWQPLQAYRDYGFTSYNFAGRAMPAASSKYMLIEALKTQKPKLVMIDLRAFLLRETTGIYTKNWLRTYSDFMPFSANRTELIQTTIRQEGFPVAPIERLYFHFDLLRYHGRWSSLDEEGVALHNFRYYSRNKGYHFFQKHKAFPQEDDRGEEGRLPILASTQEILTELLEFCKENELQVLFFTSPHYCREGDKQRYNTMKDLIDSFGYPMLNTNDVYSEMGIDLSADLYDEHHVNSIGATKFSRYMAQYLHENYSLPDHRGDPAWKGWDELIPEWEKALADKTLALQELIKKTQG